MTCLLTVLCICSYCVVTQLLLTLTSLCRCHRYFILGESTLQNLSTSTQATTNLKSPLPDPQKCSNGVELTVTCLLDAQRVRVYSEVSALEIPFQHQLSAVSKAQEKLARLHGGLNNIQ